MVKIPSLALVGLLMLSATASASDVTTLEPVVVTATKIETPTREVASSITVVTAEEIEEKQQRTVLEALRDVPAVDVVQSGGDGQQTSVFMRGANSEHTLVLIDGIEVNDPISPSKAFNFANLTTDNVERIEILRGPASALYGSDAIGGVINIITKKGQGKPSITLSAEGGSFETHHETVSLSGGTQLVNYALSASYLDSNGITAARWSDGNHERDGYENLTTSLRLGLTPTKNFDLDFILRYMETDTDIDNSAGPLGDDPNYTTEEEKLFFRTQAGLYLFDDLWEQKLGFSITDYDRSTRDDTDAAHPLDWVRSSYQSTLYKVDWQHNLYLHKTNTLTLGIEHEEEEGKNKFLSESAYGPWNTYYPRQKTRTTGYYVQDQFKLWNRFFTTLGLRLDDHEEFGRRVTYHVASSYIFDSTGTKIRATWGTGFKAPSLVQLYDTNFGGNPDLNPEKSEGWDVGIDQNLWQDRLTISLTYFENSFEDLIVNEYLGWGPTGAIYLYKNVDSANSKGIELLLTCRPLETLTITAGYTYTDTENEDSHDQLLRRPRNKFTADINYRFLEKGNVNLSMIYVGKREDSFYNNATWASGRVELASYTLFNLGASYEVTKWLTLSGRIENLLNEHYEETWGYDTAGIAGYMGAKLTF
ncbi:cobalamin uptake ligand-gated TonB-dependent outer membrane channel [Syntrophotalea carbinolica DSM 2380]|uniref:Cobalamin uptake ligand-gated TonB-dependent outer membrane channel n=1 Tax=Syntrophotalea carbinolica (strain DSM 2380 / NBRC 103641 / GraBd1) TaxID=338963 RepID=Q3A7D0_SYNC1|nr:TonB-dependent receptor [Syntrophotalea carbinolica]ABA87714.1 cobalamin uptake ligand-gated TonB-dependent outer membrane channel [Syntrophotalea carbinolica DSM 2380]